MSKGKRAFETLGLEDQKTLIDVNAAIAVIMARLPDMLPPVGVVIEALAMKSLQSNNVITYAMQDVWDALLEQDWTFVVTKRGAELTTQFIPTKTAQGDNGPEDTAVIVP